MYNSSDSDEVLSESSDGSSIPSLPYSPLSCVGDGTATLESSSSPEKDDDVEEGFLPISDSDDPMMCDRPKTLYYKIVGDNIDKNVRQSFQRMDMTTQSLHYFHSYAVKDRINTTAMSDEPHAQRTNAESLLPSAADLEHVLEDFRALVSR